MILNQLYQQFDQPRIEVFKLMVGFISNGSLEMITPQFLPVPPITLQIAKATQFYSKQKTTLSKVFKLSFTNTYLYSQAKEVDLYSLLNECKELFFAERITKFPILIK